MVGLGESYYLSLATLRYPAIDNHAHPLLRSTNRDTLPLEGIISEASGLALINDAPHTLACIRATRQLAQLLGLSNDATWEDVKAKRASLDYIDLCKRCFKPTEIHCILLDDGLDLKENMEGLEWHNQFVKIGIRRIVRIETEAEALLKELFTPLLGTDTLPDPILHELFLKFNPKFEDHLKELIQSTGNKVVGLKSIICYRTGLGVSLNDPQEVIKLALHDIFLTYRQTGALRLQHKPLNDHVLRLALNICQQTKIPMQLHTGLGDNDISLVLASPSLLQPLIKTYPEVNFVLLHASYPFTREAGYLTSVYSNVFLDFGEVFPQVSGQGQRDLFSQILELCPTNKIMFSTDGHYWPESYYLASFQARLVLYEVLIDLLRRAELIESQAIEIVKASLFNNANRIYGLGLPTPDDAPIFET